MFVQQVRAASTAVQGHLRARQALHCRLLSTLCSCVHFLTGKDIMIPTAENVCGPLCGYNLTTLRAKSIWALGEADLQVCLRTPLAQCL